MSHLPLDLGCHELNSFQRECCHVAEVGLCHPVLAPLLGDGSKVVSRVEGSHQLGLLLLLHRVKALPGKCCKRHGRMLFWGTLVCPQDIPRSMEPAATGS